MDSVEIKVKAGRGGNGLASFWREKFQPFGGPDGGDGGKGGDIYIFADVNTTDLSQFRHNRSFKAGDGITGGKQKKHGKNGEDAIIKVPVGTSVYRLEEDNKVLAADMVENRQKAQVAKGGKGGLGNVHFATSTNQAPRQATSGKEGEHFNIVLEYNIPADVAIVGLPNSGKSSLLFKMTRAPSKIADYPFTTVEPLPGRAEAGGKFFTITDMPALIKGSSEGKGLGSKFLRHSLKAMVIVLLLDGSSEDIKSDLKVLEGELKKFDTRLLDKKLMVAVNKIDLPEVREKMADIKKALKRNVKDIYFISALSGENLDALLEVITAALNVELPAAPAAAPEEVVFRPKPMKRRELM
jgi:GTPase